MNTLEQEVIEKFHQLDKAAQKRVRELIEQEIKTDAVAFDYDAWFRDMESLRLEIRASHDDELPSVDVVGNRSVEQDDSIASHRWTHEAGCLCPCSRHQESS